MNDGRTNDARLGANAPWRGDDSSPRRGLLTVREGAAWLGCSVGNVYSLIEKGRLPVVCVGERKGYRLDRRDLEAFVEERKFRYEAAPVDRRQQPLKHLKL